MKSKILLSLFLSISAMPLMFGPPPVDAPDSGPTISLLAIALVGLIAASRRRFRK
ncbi:MAG: VPDSG-CTERM sorting domain-containing protein [Opitutales bacterium]|nr:VPDSG-CTERM sorting domain-containing protein [Opitutales bacterium]MBT5167297.1 VPDSG-CTERM sorting domain-containing protein [Opitutales bacterium]MBT5814000.1 VPDSG-CTERM sorting domain-containing protein [Opitutales bacterium]MBT6379720.1 VPDSG-CTERM sorting domain-containing protein [Opitutales bacterium]MBT6769774.1 VPDSG-CTERM sorting domain-containing protein [Opitutales bacterium]